MCVRKMTNETNIKFEETMSKWYTLALISLVYGFMAESNNSGR